MSTQALSAATQDRKARLAQLKSLKRKQAPDASPQDSSPALDASDSHPAAQDEDEDAPTPLTSQYLSGRNYDSATRGPKLGFESAPDEGQDTVEARAAALELSEREARDAEAATADAPLDLFKLQPKRANWDLKRDLAEANRGLRVRTENAFARKLRGEVRAGGVDVVAAVGGMESEDKGEEFW